ncbi:MAG: hypothetical protein ACLRX9_01185 [Streptococcus salivarius]
MTDDDNLVYAQLYDAYGNDVLLFRVDKKGQLEAYGGIDGSSDSWDVVSKIYNRLMKPYKTPDNGG